MFGQIKNTRGFRRFLLNGLQKVSKVVGWLSLAHNLLKKFSKAFSLFVAMKIQPITTIYISV
ncbi:transposase [Paenibacillus tarimensis]|nr:transposase [Paenibacillus tarimensis]